MSLTFDRDEYRPGGVANTVANLAALSATAVPAGPIEADPSGDEFLKLLARTGCDLATVVRNPATRTVTKTRIVASGTQGGPGQHLLRVDCGWERAHPTPQSRRCSYASSNKRPGPPGAG